MGDDSNGSPPRKPSVRRLFASPADSARVTDAQNRILDGLRSGVVNLINRFFDDAGEVVRASILYATMDLYNEGIARGRAQAIVMYRAYISIVRKKYEDMVRDPRVEMSSPDVSAAELCVAVNAMGVMLTQAETRQMANDLQLPLSLDTLPD